MKILILHNRYEFPGGEDEAVRADVSLLEAAGHETYLYQRTFDDIPAKGLLARTGMALQVPWSISSYREIRRLVQHYLPDVAHFHNIFPLISPSAYAACRAEGVPVVQTLHNYRIACPPGTLFRDGKICELCVGAVPWPAVRFGCYRGSKAQSLVMAATLGAHAALGTWRRQVDAFIALTEFGKQIFVRSGLPRERIFVRPNAVDGGVAEPYRGPHSAIFVGRLSPEKGVDLLLQAWREVDSLPLTIVGDGPLLGAAKATILSYGLSAVQLTGQLPHAEVQRLIRRAGMLVFPSLWYEGLGLVLLEALAAGIPVIASDIGAQAEAISHGLNGLLFAHGDAASLAANVNLLSKSPELAASLAFEARRRFEDHYSIERSYKCLIDIYGEVFVRNSHHPQQSLRT